MPTVNHSAGSTHGATSTSAPRAAGPQPAVVHALQSAAAELDQLRPSLHASARAHQSDLAAELLATAEALLSCWTYGLPADGETVDDSASTLQIGMRAISELLARAEEPYANSPAANAGDALHVMFAKGLACAIEGALWNIEQGDETTEDAPGPAELRRAAKCVRQYVASARDALHVRSTAQGAAV